MKIADEFAGSRVLRGAFSECAVDPLLEPDVGSSGYSRELEPADKRQA
jgi:hypothetical protein